MSDNQEKAARTPPLPSRLPDPMSGACARFLDDLWEVSALLIDMWTLTLHLDDISRQAARSVLQTGLVPGSEKPRLARIATRGEGYVDALMEREQLLLQMFLCRAVDNYLSYISDILALIYAARPEALRSNEQVRLDEVLQFKSMEELITFLIERRVHSLSFKGMGRLADYLDNRLGIKLFANEQTKMEFVRIVELRNLITHNRAVVNRVFKERLPSHPAQNGERLTFEFKPVFRDIGLLLESACDIEDQAGTKFGFPRTVPRAIHDSRFLELDRKLDKIEAHLKALVGDPTKWESIIRKADAQ